MTSTTTSDTTVSPGAADLTREQRFIRRLAAAHHSGTLGALRQWHPGQIDTRVIALTQDASRGEYDPWALTAKAFTLFHSGRLNVLYGYEGNGIGGWARRVGGGTPTIDRLVTALNRAQNPLDLDRQLTALARMNAGSARFSPHWQTVLSELVTWSDPARRDDVRFTWARDYNTFTPSATTDTTT